jgi:hypothetical protein
VDRRGRWTNKNSLDAIAKREFNFAKNGFLIAEIIKGVNKILFVQTNLT